MAWHIISTRRGSYACADDLARFLHLRHGVTLREIDGESFNLSFSVTDERELVRRNREIACVLFVFKVDDLVMPAQAHGSQVAIVGAEHRASGALEPHTAVPGCDALVTDTPNLLLGITVADCLPVFCFDPVHNVVGLAHSGWRGTAGRIAPRTIQAMTQAFGSSPADCLVAIGPGIGPEAYEIDRVVYDSFTPEDAAAPGVFTPTAPGHWSLDLSAAVTFQLTTCGVPCSHIYVSPWRTNRETDLFFSHRLHPGCPRMGAFIGLLPGE